MAYVTNGNKIGDWVITTQRHESLCRIFEKGTKVKIIDINPIRGYAIEDEHGNKMIEIGWVI